MHPFHFKELADFYRLFVAHVHHFRGAQEAVFLQFVFQEGQSQFCSVHGHIDLFQYIGHSADMVFVAVGNDDALDFLLVLN